MAILCKAWLKVIREWRCISREPGNLDYGVCGARCSCEYSLSTPLLIFLPKKYNKNVRIREDATEELLKRLSECSEPHQGDMTPEIECIRDCALLHRTWYNEAGCYPRKKHTANKPLVNILILNLI